MILDDLIFGDTERARKPSEGRKETVERRRRVVEGEVVAARERTSVVDGSVGRLLLEHGEQRQSHQGQAYVYRCRSQEAVRVHLLNYFKSSVCTHTQQRNIYRFAMKIRNS